MEGRVCTASLRLSLSWDGLLPIEQGSPKHDLRNEVRPSHDAVPYVKTPDRTVNAPPQTNGESSLKQELTI